MIISTLITIIITSTLSLLLSNTPIMLGINILLMALLLSVTLAAFISSWYAFLVFLIYIGGILVIFAYFLALGPNQQMPHSSNIVYITFTVFTIFFVIYYTGISGPIAETRINSTAFLYYRPTAPILIILALILLLTIIVVVKLTARTKGPLRPFFYV